MLQVLQHKLSSGSSHLAFSCHEKEKMLPATFQTACASALGPLQAVHHAQRAGVQAACQPGTATHPY